MSSTVTSTSGGRESTSTLVQLISKKARAKIFNTRPQRARRISVLSDHNVLQCTPIGTYKLSLWLFVAFQGVMAELKPTLTKIGALILLPNLSAFPQPEKSTKLEVPTTSHGGPPILQYRPPRRCRRCWPWNAATIEWVRERPNTRSRGQSEECLFKREARLAENCFLL